jgi:tetratricopeptide (TPR) repeat protein/TolB-like protein
VTVGLIAVLASAAGCTRSKTSTVPTPRLAVLRCENLSADVTADWMGRAISEILSAQLSGVPGSQVVAAATVRATGATMGARPLRAPGVSTEREAALAAGANRLVACEYSIDGGVLRLSAQVEDLRDSKVIQRAHAEAPVAGGVVAPSGALAMQLSPQSRPYTTRNQDAVHAYAEGLDTPDPAAAGQLYERAVAADPNFGAAYEEWISAEVARRNAAGAQHVLDLAKARGDAIPAYERARLSLAAAELKGDSVARMQALSALAKTGPQDAGVYKGLAEAALQGRRYRDAVNAYQQALALAPTDVGLLNSLGYAEAYLGDLDRALDALRKYERLQPGQANPIDSQADVNFYTGHYAEAEKLYLAAQAKDPNFLGGAEILKAAQARLATGDMTGADTIFQQYANQLDARHDPGATFRKAQWKYLSGRRKEAVAMLSANPAPSPQDLPQLVIWKLSMGDRAGAEEIVRSMSPKRGTPILLLALAAFLSQPPAPATEWENRAKTFGQSPLHDQFIAYALLFGRDFRGALPFLRRSWEQMNPNTEEGMPVLLAWAMSESGQWNGLTSMVGPTPIPAAAGPGLLASLYFPRLFYLRGRNYDRLGKHDQALENYRLFLKLAGPDAEVWGDEQRAREAVGR